MDIAELLKEEKFNFVSKENKKYIIHFTKEINSINYDFDGDIRNGFERGNYQIIYSLNGIKGSRNINKHINYIENATSNIKEHFINNSGLCKYCTEQCYKRKTFTINGKEIAKCADVFEYINPTIKEIKDFIGILKEFYGKKVLKNKRGEE